MALDHVTVAAQRRIVQELRPFQDRETVLVVGGVHAEVLLAHRRGLVGPLALRRLWGCGILSLSLCLAWWWRCIDVAHGSSYKIIKTDGERIRELYQRPDGRLAAFPCDQLWQRRCTCHTWGTPFNEPLTTIDWGHRQTRRSQHSLSESSRRSAFQEVSRQHHMGYRMVDRWYDRPAHHQCDTPCRRRTTQRRCGRFWSQATHKPALSMAGENSRLSRPVVVSSGPSAVWNRPSGRP